MKAMNMLLEYFEATGSDVVFGYDSRFDAINIRGQLNEVELNGIPDIGAGYYVEPGEYQDDYRSEH